MPHTIRTSTEPQVRQDRSILLILGTLAGPL
jgi:hypothetical protein